jgi:hypothetical protein
MTPFTVPCPSTLPKSLTGSLKTAVKRIGEGGVRRAARSIRATRLAHS